MRLDAGVRIDPTNDRVSVSYNGGMSVVVTLTSGLYLSLAALLAELQTRLRASVHASYTCTESAGVVTISWTGGIASTLTWTRTALRNALGFGGSSTAGTTSVTAPNVAGGVFVASLPWDDPQPVAWRLSLLRARHLYGDPRSFVRGYQRRHGVIARVQDSETIRFRSVLLPFLRGVPGTLYRDTTVTTAWSWSNWYGAVPVQLDLEQYGDDWAGARRDYITLSLPFVEYS